jgi:uncharacterized membrane protein YkvA (DUF1232 family)
MVRKLAGLGIAAAAVLASVALRGTVAAAATPASHIAVAIPGAMMAADLDEPMERQVSGFVRSVFREIRWSFRMLRWMFWRAVDWWGRWFKRAAFSIGVAIIAALADGGLVNAWRAEGLRTLLTYSVLMLYVYGRLLFSAGVKLAPKLLLIGALIYGVFRRDLIPDRSMIPGRIEDIVLIVVATRTFVYACPEALVNEYAERAVNLKRRVMAIQRARPQ